MLLLLTILIAFGLRANRLNFQPLWWDEGYSLYFATMNLAAMVAGTASDIHPPFYYALLHVWIALLGSGAVAVRLLSVFVGTLTIPLLYRAGRRLIDGKIGTLASLVMAIAPFHVYYSQEVRMYGLVTLLGLLSVHFALLLLGTRETASGRRQILLWAGYVATTLAAMYTQYYAAFIPLFQTVFVIGAFVLSQLKRKERPIGWRGISAASLLVRWLAAQGVLFLLYVPWIIYAGRQLAEYVIGKVGHEGYRPLGLWAFFGQHLATFGLGHLTPDQGCLYWAGWLFFLLAFLGVLGYYRRLRFRSNDFSRPGTCATEVATTSLTRGLPSITFLLLYLLVPLLMAYSINLRFPFAPVGMERLSLLATPAYYLLIGLGLAWLWKGPRPLFWLSNLALIWVSSSSLYSFYTVERYPQDDYRPLIARVQTMASPDDAVFCIYPWQVGYFKSYYRGERPQVILASSGEWSPSIQRELEVLLSEGPALSKVEGRHVERRRLWVPAYQAKGGIMESQVEQFLLANSYPVLNEWYGTTRLSFYAAKSQMSASQGHLNFDHRLQLLQYALDPGPVEAGWGVVTTDLLWLKTGRLDGRYLVGLRLTDQAGRTWGQRDSEPRAGLSPFSTWREGEQMLDHHGLLVPAGTPPGDYQLRLGVYRAADEQGLTVLDEDAVPQGTEAVLGIVQVIPPGLQPPVETLAIGHPLSADLADPEKGRVLRLLGYSLGEGSVKPGQALKLTLFWQALADVSRDYTVFVQLQDEKGKLWANRETAPVDGSYPTAGWQAGQLLRDPHDLVVPAAVPDGPYHLVVGLYRATDRERLAVVAGPQSGQDNLALTEVKVLGREHDYLKPIVSHPLQARLGESIVLIGCDLEAQQARPGDKLGLTLYWHALSPVDKSYTVFVHLLDADEVIQGWGDSLPGGGTLPTTSWLAGEYLRDRHEIAIKPEAPPGEYLIEVGLYEALGGTRLPVLGKEGQVQGDKVFLADIIRILAD